LKEVVGAHELFCLLEKKVVQDARELFTDYGISSVMGFSELNIDSTQKSMGLKHMPCNENVSVLLD
jgi:hypothetical protein